MDFADIKNKSAAELKELLAEEQGKLHALRIQAGGKQLKQVHKVAAARQAIARIQTVLEQNNSTAK